MSRAMQALQTVIPLILAGSLAALTATMGMNVERGDLGYLVRRPALMLRSVTAVNIVVPIAACLIVALFPLSPVARAGIILMAISPVPPLVPGKAAKVGGHRAYAYGLYVALALLAVPIVPLSVAILSRLYGVELSLPVAMVARNVLVTVLLPLAVGLAISHFLPAIAPRLAGFLNTVATALLLLALVAILVAAWPVIAGLVGDGTLAACALTVLAAIAGGHLLGGPDLQERATLAVTAGMRHPGIAMMIAGANDADPRVKGAILAFLLVGLVVGVPYQAWIRRRAPAAAPAEA